MSKNENIVTGKILKLMQIMILYFTIPLLLVACLNISTQDNRTENRVLANSSTSGNETTKNLDIGQMKIIAITPSSDLPTNIKDQLIKSLPGIDFSECTYSENIKLCSYGKDRGKKLDNLVRAIKKSTSENTIIWAARGGYGSYCLVESLPQSFSHKQCVIIGYSDVTTLLLYTAQKYGWKNIHGAVLKEWLDKDKRSNIQSVVDYLNGTKMPIIDDIIPLNKKAETTAVIKATLTGGNMALLDSSIGTIWEVKTNGKILLVEDCHETPQRLYRTLVHMKQAGILKGCVAIIFGEFICYNEADNAFVDAALKNFAHEIAIPVYKSNKFGHGSINVPFVFNVPYKLEKRADKFVLSMK
ncbi:MAG: LD-carboxypeptidase [Holosporales bacterium]|jgi:muramoyltetrapeptide carboxypeptidase|nr:LD-carboxypeptidase [Holosporales bacterium]